MFCHKTEGKVSEKYFIRQFISRFKCGDIFSPSSLFVIVIVVAVVVVVVKSKPSLRNVSSHATPRHDILNHFAMLSYTNKKRKLNYFMTEKYFSFFYVPFFFFFFILPYFYYAHGKWNRNDDINKFLESLNNFSYDGLNFIFLFATQKGIFEKLGNHFLY